jgi:hypothetical protein
LREVLIPARKFSSKKILCPKFFSGAVTLLTLRLIVTREGQVVMVDLVDPNSRKRIANALGTGVRRGNRRSARS